MNALDKLASLGLSEAPAATQIATLNVLTVRDITTQAAREYLRVSELWLKDPITRARNRGKIGAWMQTVADKEAAVRAKQPDAEAPTATEQAVYGALVALEAALYDQSAINIHSSTDPTIAGQVAQTLGGLQLVGAMAVEDAAGWYALGGGLQFQGFDADALAAAHKQRADTDKAAEEAEARQQAADELQATRNARRDTLAAAYNTHVASLLDDAETLPTIEALAKGLEAAATALRGE